MAHRLTIHQLIKESKEAIEGYLSAHIGALASQAELVECLKNRDAYREGTKIYAEWMVAQGDLVVGDEEHPDFNGVYGVYEEVEWEAEFGDAPFCPASHDAVWEWLRDCYDAESLSSALMRDFGRDTYWEMRLNCAVEYHGGVAWCMADAWLQLHNAKTLNETFVALEKCFALQHHNGNLLRDHSEIPNLVIRKVREHGLASYIPPQEINELAAIYGE